MSSLMVLTFSEYTKADKAQCFHDIMKAINKIFQSNLERKVQLQSKKLPPPHTRQMCFWIAVFLLKPI